MNITVKFANTVLPSVLDYQILLGEGTGASSCSVILADDGELVSTLINHTLTNGGIKPLPEATTSIDTTAGTSAGIKTLNTNVTGKVPYSESPFAVVGVSPYGNILMKGGDKWKEAAVYLECLRQSITKPHQIAFVLAVIKGETHWRLDTVNTYDAAGKTKWRGRGLAQVTFIFNYQRAAILTGVKEILDTPELVMTNPGINVAVAVATIRAGTTSFNVPNRSYSKNDIQFRLPNPNSDFVTAYKKIQGGVYRTDYFKYYKEYLGRLQDIAKLAESVVTVTEDVTTTDTTKKVAPSEVSKVIKVDDNSAIPKGSKILINIDDNEFTFWHTGTMHDSLKKQTTLTGQGLRWVLNRVERNSTQTGITLQELATKILTANKLKLKYLAKLNPKYDLVQQKQISDYALLKQEVTKAGLFLTEDKETVIISDISEAVRKGIKRVLSPYNTLNLVVEDTALDAADTIPDAASSYSQFESKVAIDLASGQLVAKTPEIVGKAGSTGVSGKATEETSKTTAADTPAVKANQSRYKRVNGLPTTITLPIDLSLQPLDVVRTVEFPGTLNRVWLVHTVTHSSTMQTILTVTSPITIVDTQPVNLNSGGIKPTEEPIFADDGKWVYPSDTKARVTSEYGQRKSPTSGKVRLHAGIDTGQRQPARILAARDGIVSGVDIMGGYGKIITINHGSGIETRYAHLSTFLVKKNDKVKGGQVIGVVGNTGIGTGEHLHFEYRVKGQFLNPRKLPIKWD